nr:UDP-glucuronosyltransferase 2C1-like [Lytechinus pictus]
MSQFMIMALILKFSILSGVLTAISEGSNIAISGGPGLGSHFFVAASLGEELVRRGHNVTAILGGDAIATSHDDRYSKLFHFAITNRRFSEEELRERVDVVARAAVSGNFLGELNKHLATMQYEMYKDCDALLLDEDFIQSLVDAKFDLLIVDPYFGCTNLLPVILNEPVIFMIPTHLEDFLARAFESPIDTALHPYFGSGFPRRMTFWQRFRNFIQPSFVGLTFRGVQQYCSSRNIPPSSCSESEVFGRAELFLVNMDFAVEFPFPIAPNVIPVGGITTRPSKKLDVNLEEFVQSSGEDGIIIFTMGSYATYMKEELIKEFITAFSRLPQKVVWKMTRDLPKEADQSKIKTMPWLPQNDLLAHNKTKLIIYQGGHNGFYEVVDHGVPSVVIPLLMDQFDVASRTVHHGMGIELDYHTLNANIIVEAVRTVLGNNSYTKNAERISSIYRHRTMRPVEKAAFWVEHVIQHGGTLKSAIGELSWYEYHQIDVLLSLFSIIIIILVIVFLTLRLGLRLICNVFQRNRGTKDDKLD